MPYQYNFQQNRDYTTLYIGVAALVVIALILVPGITGFFSAEENETTITTTTVTTLVPTKAVLNLSTQKFKGFEKNLEVSGFDVEITPEDTDILHGFYVQDVYVNEKIKLKGNLHVGKHGVYLKFDEEDMEFGTYFSSFNVDSPQKVWFLGNEMLLIDKTGSDLKTGKSLGSAVLAEEPVEVFGLDLEASDIDESNGDVRIKLDGKTAVIDEGEMEKVKDYYVYVKNIQEASVEVEIFEEDDEIRDGEVYNDCWDYFVVSDSFGIRNRCDYDVYDELEVGNTMIYMDISQVESVLLKGRIKTREGNLMLELSLSDELFKTSDGFENRIFIRDHDYCLDLDCDREVGDLYGIMLPGSAAYRKIDHSGDEITIFEGEGRIVVGFDEEEEETNVWIEETGGSKISDVEDGYYSLFGSKFIDVNPSGGSFEVELANSRRTFSLKVGRLTQTSRTKTLKVGETVNVDGTEVGLRNLK